MARLALSLFGPFELRISGEPVRRNEGDKVQALLAYLAVEYHHAHRREALGELLWPERQKGSVYSNLRKALFKLRQAIGDAEASPPYLLTSQRTIQWNTASDTWVDVSVFESLIEAVQEHQHSSLESCDACTGLLKQALGLYCGDFLADLSLADSAEFQDWAIVKREGLRRQALEALDVLSVYHQDRAEHHEAVSYARRQTLLDPLSEAAHCHLMELLALAGQRSEALAQYQTCSNMLAEELGLEPGEDTTQLRDRILAGEFQRGRERLLASTDSLTSPAASAASISTPVPNRGAEAPPILLRPGRGTPRFSKRLRMILTVLIVALLAGASATARRLGGTLGQDSPESGVQPESVTITPEYGEDVVIPPSGVLHIAALGPATGSLATLFDRMRASMNLVAREYGGVYNVEVRFILFDTEGNQSSALAAAQALVADPTILAVIGPVTSIDAFAVLPVLEDAHILSISPSATRHNLTALAPTTFNRVILNQYQPGSGLGLEVDELPGVQAFYAVHPELIEGLTEETRVFVPLTYDAAMLLLMKLSEVAAVTSDGSIIINRQALLDAIRSTNEYQGVTGSITIDQTGNRMP